MWKSKLETNTVKKMAYENTGSLSKNKRKEQPKHPDMRGPATITCPCCGEKSEFWVSGWFKIGRDAAQFISLGFRPKVPDGDQATVGNDTELRNMPMMRREEDDNFPF